MLEILKPIVEAITQFISILGYPGIFILMTLESALVPIPSEIIMPFSGFLSTTGRLEPVGVIIAGSIGNLVGSIMTYYLGLKIGRTLVLKYGKYILFKRRHLELTERLFAKYGEKISFIGRLLPGIRTYVSLPAGLGKTRPRKFVLYTLAGVVIWNSLLTFIGMQLGRRWQNIDKYSVYLDIIAVALVAAFVIYFVYTNRRDRHKNLKID
ncbi:MAG TPA: DedA family protein [Nitrososphaeraceae archaeon]|jgi:membrane protein DedA with SNARE-associated domain|nr:DedA family protein [Nitrososphaeraceae archaeon]